MYLLATFYFNKTFYFTTMCSASSSTANVAVSLNEEAERLKNEGNQCFKEQRFNKSIYFYTKALEEQVHPVILSNRAQAYLNLHRPQEAYLDADEALRMDSHNLKALYRRAQALSRVGLKARAYADLKKYIQIDPANKAATQLMENLREEKDMDVLDVYCFHKDESLQANTPLTTIKIVKS